jgi:DNA-3-methyladenine glycosylase I
MPRSEHGAPAQTAPKSLGDYLEVMSKAVFQTGISWQVVEKKWPGIRTAFKGFHAGAVAGLTDSDVSRLLADSRVIRNRRKIEGIVGNARRMIELDDQHGSFRQYLRSHGDFESLIKSLRKEFKFLGNMGAYYFLYVVREKVPPYEEFCRTHGIRHM